MKINAVFFDIDGTFFDHVSGMVLPETLTAVKKLRENGYKVCLCSGRAKEMAEQLGVLQMTAWDGYVGGAGVSVYNERMELISEHAFTENRRHVYLSLAGSMISVFSRMERMNS